MSEKINVKKEGEIITIKPGEVGSIAHTFRVLEGRATLIESPHNNVLKNGLSLTSACQVAEVNRLISVLETLRDIMLTQLTEKALAENTKVEEEIPPGTLVETNDGRYGIVKKVDWHARLLLKRNDYQIQFPNGIGIFRKDEFKVLLPTGDQKIN